MARLILAVVAGYLLFAFSATMLFALSSRDPHTSVSVRFMAVSVVYGIFFSIVAGYLAEAIAERPVPLASSIVAGLIALMALVSLIARPGAGAVWSQAAAVVVMAPATLLGGRFQVRSRKPPSKIETP